MRKLRTVLLFLSLFVFCFCYLLFRAQSEAAGPEHAAAVVANGPSAARTAADSGQTLAISSGTVEFKTLQSGLLTQPVNYSVYLPASYSTGKASYPLIIFLHGLFENERRWAERGGKDVLDNLIAENKIGEMVAAIPDGGRSFYTNSYDGSKKYEAFVVQEFIPFVEENYRVKHGAKWLGLSGSSMGGYGALKIGMKHSSLFSSVSAHSAVLVPKFPETIEPGSRQARYLQILEGPFGKPFHRGYWESENPIHLAENPEKFKGLALYFDCGDHDRYGFDEGARDLHRVLEEKGFPHEFAILPGDHGWEYLKQYMHRSLAFHWKNFGR